MTPALPELNGLPADLVLDGELVAWRVCVPYFPTRCRRILSGDTSIALTYMVLICSASTARASSTIC
jgi:hypothetical protein